MARKPAIGVLCCNEVAERPIQSVASRFVAPLAEIAGACVLLVPAMPDVTDAIALVDRLDGLLLTGSRSHVAAHRYGGDADIGTVDPGRDEVALRLAGHMIEAGKPVYGICRGLQELNVLFGGSLSRDPCSGRHLRSGGWQAGYPELFDHRHDVRLAGDGTLARATGERRLTVTSVHEQAIDRLGGGLSVEARAVDDQVIEAVAARPCGADVLAVQWHPEWDVRSSPGSRAFFALVGEGLRGATQ